MRTNARSTKQLTYDDMHASHIECTCDARRDASKYVGYKRCLRVLITTSANAEHVNRFTQDLGQTHVAPNYVTTHSTNYRTRNDDTRYWNHKRKRIKQHNTQITMKSTHTYRNIVITLWTKHAKSSARLSCKYRCFVNLAFLFYVFFESLTCSRGKVHSIASWRERERERENMERKTEHMARLHA